MAALGRLAIFGFMALTIVYLVMAWFVRSTRRQQLEQEWDAANPGGSPETRRIEVEQDVEAFRKTLAYRSLWLIYVLPVIFVIAVLVNTNWN